MAAGDCEVRCAVTKGAIDAHAGGGAGDTLLRVPKQSTVGSERKSLRPGFERRGRVKKRERDRKGGETKKKSNQIKSRTRQRRKRERERRGPKHNTGKKKKHQTQQQPTREKLKSNFFRLAFQQPRLRLWRGERVGDSVGRENYAWACKCFFLGGG